MLHGVVGQPESFLHGKSAGVQKLQEHFNISAHDTIQDYVFLGISGVYTEVNTWQCQADADAGIFGSQIDLLIVRKDQIINLCEMKYSETDYIVSAAFIKDQKRKIHDFRQITGTKYAIHSTLITTYAVENNAYAGELQAVITAEDLFR